ncbi:MAG: trypsin-like peptidase domain-containing protein [Xenococcaceae cyanobacterium MO_207.B15]|nr:trypsin-like peptidase domain-containing protein [Xenococcaceae cyanobacterium MO_207.B15]
MYLNKNITRILAVIVSLNSCLIFSNKLNATSFDTNQKTDSPLMTFSQKNKAEKNYTGIVKKIDDIAQKITVKIDNLSNNSHSSGVIIAHQRDTYYFVTAKHVLCSNFNAPKCEPNGQHQIVTPDGAIYKLDYQTVETPQTWLDLAIVKFKSDKTYTVATLGNYQWGDQWVFVSGFTNHNQPKNSKPSRILTAGKVFPQEQAAFAVKDAYFLTGGNELVYTNDTYPGMGGGAVLDTQGRLIGINIGTEGEFYFDELGNYKTLNLGYSLGIPIKYFLGLLVQGKMQLNKLKNYQSAISFYTQAIKINPQYVQAYLDRANAYQQLKQYDSAIFDYKQAIKDISTLHLKQQWQ